MTKRRHVGSSPPGARDPSSKRLVRFDRRLFLQGLTLVGGAAAAGGGLDHVAGAALDAAGARRGPKGRHASAKLRKIDGVSIPVSAAILAENAKQGDPWWVTRDPVPRDIEGFASQVSAKIGDTVTLFVNTTAPTFHVEAYRMGYYRGVGGRLVWRSAEVPGTTQPDPVVVAPTNTVECQWQPSIQVRVGRTWPPGAYLLKLVGAGSEQQFVPLCVRDDTSHAAVVIQSSVTTWQAYNRWGGYSLYYGNFGNSLSFTHAPGSGDYAHRARVVSFDRPYDHDWASGAADFVGNELPVIFDAERLGLDVTYWTDVDLHTRPQLLANHRALVSLGHDEYWSAPMRQAGAAGLAGGVNLAFLGANASYRQIRFQPSALGPNRRQVCYKSASEDPFLGVDDALVTVNWPQAPVSQPESLLIGSTYQDVGAEADMVISDASSWLLDGTGLRAGQSLPRVVVGEFDRYVPGAPGPDNVDVVAHSVVPNRGNNHSDVTWYTEPGGGGVFASGNASWVGNLTDCPYIPPNVLPEPDPTVSATLRRVMLNLYGVVALGPASATQPSTGNWHQVYAGGSGGPAPAATNTA
ncbi:MAG TPA: N,N-dimethylformamidase beta subunit family domain-containing protein [Acidimicrobiales bacterium]|jgi:hypothetical protein